MGTHCHDTTTRERLSAGVPNPHGIAFEHEVRTLRARYLRTFAREGLQRIGSRAALLWRSYGPALPGPRLLPRPKRLAGG
ncbi:MAG TPA: hypothetical protein VGU24_02400 [Microvirga sp.]|jgi:hypothetical protein|nr:hypothetical protein [Microvirga sp.]